MWKIKVRILKLESFFGCFVQNFWEHTTETQVKFLYYDLNSAFFGTFFKKKKRKLIKVISKAYQKL